MRRLLGVLGVVLLVACGWWAGHTTLTPPSESATAAAPATYQVRRGQVGRVMSFSASAKWGKRLLAYNGATGTVTAVAITGGATVAEGALVYAVDERPVVVATGAVPAYRDLAKGDEGRDVAQLQGFLARQGYYSYTVDGEYDAATVAAVKAWQDDLGIDDDGVVRHGDVVYVPQLPTRIQLSPDIQVGRQLSAGSEAVYGLGAAPSFEVRLGEDQADLVPLDASVVVHSGKRAWRGKIADAEHVGVGDLVLHLAGRAGQPVCGQDCDRVPTGREATYPVDIVAVPSTRGPVVPAAALRTDAAGATYVTGVNGNRLPARVVAADGGWSVVDGVHAGQVIMLFGDAAGDAGVGRD